MAIRKVAEKVELTQAQKKTLQGRKFDLDIEQSKLNDFVRFLFEEHGVLQEEGWGIAPDMDAVIKRATDDEPEQVKKLSEAQHNELQRLFIQTNIHKTRLSEWVNFLRNELLPDRPPEEEWQLTIDLGEFVRFEEEKIEDNELQKKRDSKGAKK